MKALYVIADLIYVLIYYVAAYRRKVVVDNSRPDGVPHAGLPTAPTPNYRNVKSRRPHYAPAVPMNR